MKVRGLVAIVVIAGAVSAAAICGDTDELPRERTVDVDALTFEDVQERALAAVQRPGEVYHLAATVESDGYTNDIWLDLAQPAARRQTSGSESVDLHYDGRHAMVLEERFHDSPCEPCAGNEAARFAPHLDWIFSDDAESQSIDEGVVDGEPTIVVRVKREAGGETEGSESATIHLDESFRPLTMRVDPAGSRSAYDVRFEDEFIAPSSLAADFFSPDSLRALAGGPRSDIERATAAGLDVYWLGDAFEEMILRDSSRYYEDIADGELNLEYGPADEFVPAPCARLTMLSLDAWDDLKLEAPDGTAQTPAGSALLYRSAVVPPRAEVTVLVPQGQAAPTPPALPDVRGDDGAARFAVIEMQDTVVIVATNCGPTGSNVYRTPDAFARLLAGVRPYVP